jgi:hypothetical protein
VYIVYRQAGGRRNKERERELESVLGLPALHLLVDHRDTLADITTLITTSQDAR